MLHHVQTAEQHTALNIQETFINIVLNNQCYSLKYDQVTAG